ncbi:MAG: hypothetical protein LBH00_03755 [Planctomycetaceae bacterium]|jgi:hypothetical protein|nr:hypothetical protein [Planctomycetaceae bacterium]
MSGPKGGRAAVGGAGDAALALAAIGVIALPVAAAGLVGYGIYKGTQAAARGIDKTLKEREKRRNDMAAEIASKERPVLSLISNAENRWQNEKRPLDAARQKAETEWQKLRSSAGTPQAKKEAEETFRRAEELFAEAESLYGKFNTANVQSKEKFSEAKRKTGSSVRTVRSIVSEGQSAADRAVGAVNQAAESARNAKLIYEETLLIIQQKAAAERKEELRRQNARTSIDSAASELQADNLTFIQDWLGNEAAELIQQSMQNAEKAFHAKQYEDGVQKSQEAVAMYRKFYSTALETKQKFENREIITDAITAALTDLQYDEPDVNYEPLADGGNAMLGNITIFAKSKGESGDMRLAIGMDGKVNIDVDNIPEGQETECHQRLLDLQTKVSDVVDFDITDWGRAKDVKPVHGDGIRVRQQIQQQEKIRQRSL